MDLIVTEIADTAVLMYLLWSLRGAETLSLYLSCPIIVNVFNVACRRSYLEAQFPNNQTRLDLVLCHLYNDVDALPLLSGMAVIVFVF